MYFFFLHHCCDISALHRAQLSVKHYRWYLDVFLLFSWCFSGPFFFRSSSFLFPGGYHYPWWFFIYKPIFYPSTASLKPWLSFRFQTTFTQPLYGPIIQNCNSCRALWTRIDGGDRWIGLSTLLSLLHFSFSLSCCHCFPLLLCQVEMHLQFHWRAMSFSKMNWQPG